MKLSSFLVGSIAYLAAAQEPAPYTDAKSGITFNYLLGSNGYFFGITVPQGSTTDFIATIGGKGSGWSGVSLGGAMLNKLLIVAWPNGQSMVSSFRKTAQYGSPPVTTGTFTQSVIANGTYTNSTHWTYTFLCSKCIQTDGTTFEPGSTSPTLGWAMNSAAPAQKTNPSSAVTKHTSEGAAIFNLAKAQHEDFDKWRRWAEADAAEPEEIEKRMVAVEYKS